MAPFIQTAVAVGVGVVVAIGLLRVLAYLAVSRLTEDDPTDIEW
jgi:hypothetical protein